MLSSQLGAGYALVPVPPVPDWYEGPGSNVYRRGVSNTAPAHAGNYVHRSPLNVVREAWPGAGWEGMDKLMFLPDGRLVPRTAAADDMFRGPEVLQPVVVSPGGSVLRTLFAAGAFFGGAAIGYKSSRDHRMLGAAGGAVLGGILGLIFR